MFSPVRVQEKGQVTLPKEIRRKLNWPKGQLVTFELTNNGVIVKSLDAMADDMLTGLGEILAEKGISLDKLMTRSVQVGGDAATREYNLALEEKKIFINALFLRAQAAVSAFQAEAKQTGADKLTEEEIEAEIQAVRRGNANADHP